MKSDLENFLDMLKRTGRGYDQWCKDVNLFMDFPTGVHFRIDVKCATFGKVHPHSIWYFDKEGNLAEMGGE